MKDELILKLEEDGFVESLSEYGIYTKQTSKETIVLFLLCDEDRDNVISFVKQRKSRESDFYIFMKFKDENVKNIVKFFGQIIDFFHEYQIVETDSNVIWFKICEDSKNFMFEETEGERLLVFYEDERGKRYNISIISERSCITTRTDNQ